MNVAVFAESLGTGGISSSCLELVSALEEMPEINAYLVGINDNRWHWLIDKAASRGVNLNEIHLSGRFDWSGYTYYESYSSFPQDIYRSPGL